jgi:trimethylamine-N-oxide reductase (cytochrome c)
MFVGLPLPRPFLEPMGVVNAAKNFAFEVLGPDEFSLRFTTILNTLLTSRWRQGTPVAGGETRYVNQTNGGPVFVYVKDGRIVRITPLDFDATDAAPWTIEARGRSFTPPHRSSLSPHGLASKSLVYSSKRLLHPMKRIDWDPAVSAIRRTRQSGYVRISGRSADIAAEIKTCVAKHGHGGDPQQPRSPPHLGTSATTSAPHPLMNAIGTRRWC